MLIKRPLLAVGHLGHLVRMHLNELLHIFRIRNFDTVELFTFLTLSDFRVSFGICKE